ncbi:MAG: holin-associated N-acetylmuramidase [Pseudomonadota bacterium]
MVSVSDVTAEILRREGGFVDDPDDPGGATNHGVTIHTMRRLGLDLDGDGDVDREDVRQLTQTQAAEILERHYFHKPRIGLLPEALHASVYDMYVNAGGAAVRVLQRLLQQFGQDVGVDGAIGPQTAAAARRVADTIGAASLADAYGIERRSYYYRIGDRRAASRKYAKRRDGGKGGWILRAEEFISARYHLTEAEHAARVSAWA